MDSFELPTIPKIYVPQPIVLNKPESQNVSNSAINNSQQSTHQNSNQSQEPPPESDSTVKANANVTPPTPKLCASCSQILLAYLAPLQQYVNQVVQIASGSNQLSAPTLIDLFNAEVFKSQNDNQCSDQPSSERPADDYSCASQTNPDTGHHWQSGSDRREHDHHEHRQHPEQNFGHSHGDHQNYNSGHDQNQDQSHEYRPPNEKQNSGGRHEEYRGHEGTSSVRSGHAPDNHYQGENQPHWSDEHNNHQQYGSESHRNVVRPTEAFEQDSKNITSPPQHQAQEQTHENREQSTSEYGSAAHEEALEEDPGLSSPYAFVTIAYNNLSATNAIILANSLVWTNNKTMSNFDERGNNITIQIPFVILISGNIDPVLKEAIHMVFDEVISSPMDVKVALLSDQSFGIRQNKLQLWKELQNYEKCLFLESSTLVVAKVTNLFEECQELSACVDWLFPDNFNCSVFIFEPSLTTYDQIISFALFHQKCSAQKDEGIAEALDEMTLLNQFFAAKWNRISFVYNFVKNDAIYTQIPAFMKYGDSIKIVNFGHMMSQSVGLGTQPNSSVSVQPWHVMFDLLASSQQDVIKVLPIDNFSKFYLNCFIQRLWPILQNPLTPLLVTKYGIGRREWSIFDLIRLLTNESGIETDDHMFTQTPITFRRIKSPAETLAKYESMVTEDEDLSNEIKHLEIEYIDHGLDKIEMSDELRAEKTVEQTIKEPQAVKPKDTQLTQEQMDERSKREWESGRIDWMGAHGSDRIINRLKKLIN